MGGEKQTNRRLSPPPSAEIAEGFSAPPSALPSVSIVVPTLNETGSLPDLLASLQHLSPQPEILFVDGGSTDGTVAWLRERGHQVLATRPGRGRQLAAGAAASHGEVLWFLHADSLVPVDALHAMRSAVQDGAPYGAFRLRFAGTALSARGMTWFYGWLRRFGLLYGDAGIFVRRDIYLRAGGFPDRALFEDRLLLRALRKLTGGGPVCLPTVLTTSSRRFAGWRFPLVFLQWIALQGLFALGVSPDRLAAHYGQKRRQESEHLFPDAPMQPRGSLEIHPDLPPKPQRERA
jgi:rSAM/selenodomain-associated transferase 2